MTPARPAIGAVRLAQRMPRTAIEVWVTDRLDPARHIDGGAGYLGRMIERLATVPLALAAYNAGPGAVAHAGWVSDNDETPTYVSSVLRPWPAVAVAVDG